MTLDQFKTLCDEVLGEDTLVYRHVDFDMVTAGTWDACTSWYFPHTEAPESIAHDLSLLKESSYGERHLYELWSLQRREHLRLQRLRLAQLWKLGLSWVEQEPDVYAAIVPLSVALGLHDGIELNEVKVWVEGDRAFCTGLDPREVG